MNWKLGLADNWRQLHKKGTVIFGWLFTVFMGFGPLLVQTWNTMPPEMKAVIPQNFQQWIAYTMFGLTFISLRYTSVRKKEDDDAGA